MESRIIDFYGDHQMLFTHKMQNSIIFSVTQSSKRDKFWTLPDFFLYLFHLFCKHIFVSRKFNLEKRGNRRGKGAAASSGGKFQNTANFSNRKMTSSSFLPKRRNELFSYFVWMLWMTFSFLVKWYFDPEVGVHSLFRLRLKNSNPIQYLNDLSKREKKCLKVGHLSCSCYNVFFWNV